MKTYKQVEKPLNIGSIEVEIDTDQLAEAIGKAIARELKPLLEEISYRPMSSSPSKLQGGSPSPEIQIDDSIVDVGASTDGLEKASETPLAKETKTKDNVSSSRDKLKRVKGK